MVSNKVVAEATLVQQTDHLNTHHQNSPDNDQQQQEEDVEQQKDIEQYVLEDQKVDGQQQQEQQVQQNKDVKYHNMMSLKSDNEQEDNNDGGNANQQQINEQPQFVQDIDYQAQTVDVNNQNMNINNQDMNNNNQNMDMANQNYIYPQQQQQQQVYPQQQQQQVYPQQQQQQQPQQVMVIKHHNQEYLEKVRRQNEQFEYYHRVLHNKPIKDENGNEKVVKLSRQERREANRKYYRLYNDRQKHQRRQGQTDFFYYHGGGNTGCSDCCIIVIMPDHVQHTYSNQGCCLNLCKLIQYIVFLPLRLLYFCFRWQYDNCGKQCCSSLQDNIPSCKGCLNGCQSVLCCENCCSVDQVLDTVSDKFTNVEVCCMNYCTIFGLCNECGFDVNSCCSEMIEFIIDNCTCLGVAVAGCLGQTCTFMGSICTCVFESGKDLLNAGKDLLDAIT